MGADSLNIVLAITSVLALVLGAGGIVGAIIVYKQFSQQKVTHLFQVYADVMNMLDQIDTRSARHYVYNMDRFEFQAQSWLKLRDDPENLKQMDQMRRAEIVCRQFDKIGFLVREGMVPTNIIAIFYSYPVLKSWYQLSPYINAVRSYQTGRNQNGHMWHFEHLCRDIIIPRLKEDKGCWKGVLLHDDLNQLVRDIEGEPRSTILNFNPGDRIWEIK